MSIAPNCPVCENSNVKNGQTLSEGILYYCSKCEHRYTDPSTISVQENYDQSYYDEKHKQWFDNPDLDLFEYIYQKILKNNPKASVLDVGCGNGAFLKFLRNKSQDFKLTGIDFHENQSVEGITFYTGNFLETNFKEEFDVIVNLAVIEHIWNVREFAKGLYRICKPNGSVITMTVNDQSLIYLFSRILKSLGVSVLLDRLYEKHHLNHFGENSLKNLMVSQGGVFKDFYPHTPHRAAIDTPKASPIMKFIYATGLSVFLTLENLTRKTILQTLIVEKSENYS